MQDREWITIPVLQYVSVDATITFWETLGFVVTYRQDRPYKYAVVERNGYQLHFAQVKGADTSAAYHGCLIMVFDIEKVYKEFSDSMKSKYGKVPSSGLPRMSRRRPQQTRFTITDPSGNSVIFIQSGESDQNNYETADNKDLSPMGKAIALAVRLRDFKEDHPAAAKTLDNILKRTTEDTDHIETAEALIMRAELAERLNDTPTATQCRERLSALNVSSEKILELKLKHGLPLNQ